MLETLEVDYVDLPLPTAQSNKAMISGHLQSDPRRIPKRQPSDPLARHKPVPTGLVPHPEPHGPPAICLAPKREQPIAPLVAPQQANLSLAHVNNPAPGKLAIDQDDIPLVGGECEGIF